MTYSRPQPIRPAPSPATLAQQCLTQARGDPGRAARLICQSVIGKTSQRAALDELWRALTRAEAAS
jgi:hypothetical protein